MRVMVTEVNNRYQPIGDKAVFHMPNIPTNQPGNPLPAAALKAACVVNDDHEVTLMHRVGRQLLVTARYPCSKRTEAMHANNAPRVFAIVTGYEDRIGVMNWEKFANERIANVNA